LKVTFRPTIGFVDKINTSVEIMLEKFDTYRGYTLWWQAKYK